MASGAYPRGVVLVIFHLGGFGGYGYGFGHGGVGVIVLLVLVLTGRLSNGRREGSSGVRGAGDLGMLSALTPGFVSRLRIAGVADDMFASHAGCVGAFAGKPLGSLIWKEWRSMRAGPLPVLDVGAAAPTSGRSAFAFPPSLVPTALGAGRIQAKIGDDERA
jgi:hypothetical protein